MVAVSTYAGRRKKEIYKVWIYLGMLFGGTESWLYNNVEVRESSDLRLGENPCPRNIEGESNSAI